MTDSLKKTRRAPAVPKTAGAESQPVPLSAVSDAALGRTLANAGRASIQARTAAHRASVDSTGVGLYYGSHWYMAAKPREMKAYLKTKLTEPGAALPDVRATTCIDWGLEHVGAAYRAAGLADRWRDIYNAVTATGAKATDLARYLQADGWEGVYFNPDVKNPLASSTDDGREHINTAHTAKKKGTYYGLKVHHLVLNYRPTEVDGVGIPKETAGLEALSAVPFFFGLARGGRHAFVGTHGEISEVHWDAQPVSKKVMSEIKLEDFEWLSGLLLVPPKTWPTNNTSQAVESE